MFWSYKVRDEIKQRFAKEITSGLPLVIRDEKTMSGSAHVGSTRGVVIHGHISDVLTDAKIANKYLFEVNDFDPMDGLPIYLDQDRFKPYMGRILCDVPSPDDKAKNYAEYFAAEFLEVIKKTGYEPELYRSSELYLSGKYNETIRLALDHADLIRAIYKEVSGSDKGEEWLPIQVICEQCKKVGTTKAIKWDGKLVSYRCEKNMVKWAEGCGHSGTIDPFDGRAKLPWKVEWPAKWKIMSVKIEGAGKDHATKGGSRDIAKRISQEVFGYPEPLDIPYNFFVIGGKKMSSSKGAGATAQEIADLLPSEILRLLMMKEPKQEIDFDAYGDTIPILFDSYDRIATEYFEKKETDWSTAFAFMHPVKEREKLEAHFFPRFSQIAYLVQMPHVDVLAKVTEMKGSALTSGDRAEVEQRSAYAKRWLSKYSPEKFKFELQEQVPELASSFTDEQYKALGAIHDYIVAHDPLDGHELHSRIHDIKKEIEIDPKELFSAIYISFLGKDSGPQVGWFLSALPRDFVLSRLAAITESFKE